MAPVNEAAFTYGVPSAPAGTYGAITLSPAQAAAFGTAVRQLLGLSGSGRFG